jgi:hypothetical protein
MFVSNPFALLSPFVPPIVMQAYVVLMVVAVVVGTLADLRHKGSAVFFARRRRRAREAAERRLGTGEMAALAIATLGSEVATSGAFCKVDRRVSHLLMSYGFAAYVASTVAMVFFYPTAPHTPWVVTALWDCGALMVLVGGSWFFFRLRVDVAHDGRPVWPLTRADLFLASLLASLACGLLWQVAQAALGGTVGTWVLFGLYLSFTTLLFASVRWSKFAHMFYKPAAAFQNRVEEASGASDLPRPAAPRPEPR